MNTSTKPRQYHSDSTTSKSARHKFVIPADKDTPSLSRYKGNGRRLSRAEIKELCREAEVYISLSYVPSGHRDHAIYCLGQYCWQVLGLVSGFEEDRVAFIKTWLFARRNFPTCREEDQAEQDIRRAVYWMPSEGGDGLLSDSTLERCCALRMPVEMLRNASRKKYNVALQKICAAALRLREDGLYIGVLSLARESGCTDKTVAKHLAEVKQYLSYTFQELSFTSQEESYMSNGNGGRGGEPPKVVEPVLAPPCEPVVVEIVQSRPLDEVLEVKQSFRTADTEALRATRWKNAAEKKARRAEMTKQRRKLKKEAARAVSVIQSG